MSLVTANVVLFCPTSVKYNLKIETKVVDSEYDVCYRVYSRLLNSKRLYVFFTFYYGGFFNTRNTPSVRL